MNRGGGILGNAPVGMPSMGGQSLGDMVSGAMREFFRLIISQLFYDG